MGSPLLPIEKIALRAHKADVALLRSTRPAESVYALRAAVACSRDGA